MTQNDYTDYIQAKGYTLAECKRPSYPQVPEDMRDIYKTYEEYRAALHDFLNGY